MSIQPVCRSSLSSCNLSSRGSRGEHCDVLFITVHQGTVYYCLPLYHQIWSVRGENGWLRSRAVLKVALAEATAFDLRRRSLAGSKSSTAAHGLRTHARIRVVRELLMRPTGAPVSRGGEVGRSTPCPVPCAPRSSGAVPKLGARETNACHTHRRRADRSPARVAHVVVSPAS